jgi:hypothetical protein
MEVHSQSLLASVGSLRKASPLHGPGTGGIPDRFSASREDSGIYAPQPALLSPAPVKADRFRQLAAGFLLASATAAALGGVPQVALAQEPLPAAPSKEQLKTQGFGLLVKSKLAQGSSVALQEGLQRLKPEVRQRLQQLPTAVQQDFVNLEPEALDWLRERVQGTTWVAIFPINNRDALVSGSALGVDVYDRALAGLKKQVAQGTIPREMEGRLADLLLRLKALTPELRGTLIQALESQAS